MLSQIITLAPPTAYLSSVEGRVRRGNGRRGREKVNIGIRNVKYDLRIVKYYKKEIAGRIDGDGGKKKMVGIAAWVAHDFFC